MPVPDLSHLTPADAAVTMRSLPRRFRAAARPVDDPEVEAWAEVPGPDGHSARDHVATAGRSLNLLRNALHQIDTHDDPMLDDSVMDPSSREWTTATGGLDGELAALSDAATALADEVDGLAADRWIRTARAPGAPEVDAMDVLRETVRTALTHLDRAEQAMTAARLAL